MHDSLITGVRINLEAFNRSAVRVVRATLEEAPALSSERTTDPIGGGASDLVGGVADMMVAQRGFEASISALRTALSLSAQTVDLLA